MPRVSSEAQWQEGPGSHPRETTWPERLAAFERAYALKSGVTVRAFREFATLVYPCDCGQPGCPGFRSQARRETAAYREIWPLDGQHGSEATSQTEGQQHDWADSRRAKGGTEEAQNRQDEQDQPDDPPG